MKYLVIGPSWVGDMVMAQVPLVSVQQQDPEAVIDVLAPAWCAPLTSRMPQVRRLIPMPFGHGQLALGARRRFARELQGESYDRAIVLPGSFKSALIPFWARIPVRTGWRGEMRYGLINDMRRLDKARYVSMSQRYGALALPANEPLPARLPRPCLTVDDEAVVALRASLGLEDPGPVLALCPGVAGKSAKRWPAGHYGAVAAHYAARGWQVWVFGNAQDEKLVPEILASLSPEHQARVHMLIGRTRLEEAVDLLSCADAVVANDSGLMHIAAALSRPVVALYGPTSPHFAPPLTARHSVLRLDLACSPCCKRVCPLGHGRCMQDLEPAQVMEALDALCGSEPLAMPV